MRRWPEKAHIKEVLLPLLCITSSSPLVLLTHHKGQSWEHCSVHHFAVNCFYVTITLKWTLQIQEMSLHMLLRIMHIFFQPLSSILIFKLISAESCSILSFSLPLAGEYNNSVITHCWKLWHLGQLLESSVLQSKIKIRWSALQIQFFPAE